MADGWTKRSSLACSISREAFRAGQLPATVQIAAKDRIAQQLAVNTQLMGPSGLRGERRVNASALAFAPDTGGL